MRYRIGVHYRRLGEFMPILLSEVISHITLSMPVDIMMITDIDNYARYRDSFYRIKMPMFESIRGSSVTHML